MSATSFAEPHASSTIIGESTAPIALPRIRITYCTQCRWMLRAAYFAQELLSTFGTAIGEIALVPATGGIFTVTLVTYEPAVSEQTLQSTASSPSQVQTVLLWDRKTEGGFPETKVLKQLLRDRIQPDKDLGHSDKKPHKATDNNNVSSTTTSTGAGAANEDIEHALTTTATSVPERTIVETKDAQRTKEEEAGNMAAGDGKGEGFCETCA